MILSVYFCRYITIFYESPSRGILELSLGVSLGFKNTAIKTIKKIVNNEKPCKSTEIQNQISPAKSKTNEKLKSNNGKKRPSSPSEEILVKTTKQKTKSRTGINLNDTTSPQKTQNNVTQQNITTQQNIATQQDAPQQNNEDNQNPISIDDNEINKTNISNEDDNTNTPTHNRRRRGTNNNRNNRNTIKTTNKQELCFKTSVSIAKEDQTFCRKLYDIDDSITLTEILSEFEVYGKIDAEQCKFIKTSTTKFAIIAFTSVKGFINSKDYNGGLGTVKSNDEPSTSSNAASYARLVYDCSQLNDRKYYKEIEEEVANTTLSKKINHIKFNPDNNNFTVYFYNLEDLVSACKVSSLTTKSNIKIIPLKSYFETSWFMTKKFVIKPIYKDTPNKTVIEILAKATGVEPLIIATPKYENGNKHNKRFILLQGMDVINKYIDIVPNIVTDLNGRWTIEEYMSKKKEKKSIKYEYNSDE